MTRAPIPADEIERVAALWTLGLLDSPPEEVFDRLVRVAQRLTGQDTAAVSLVDEKRQWFKAAVGLEVAQTSRDVAFCAHAILGDGLNVIDTHADPRFFDNPLVTGAPYIRSYFGRTIRGPSGHALGTLCVFGPRAGILDETQLAGLRDLAKLTEELIRLRADWNLLGPR
jgi:GAF domain-containing protein